LNDNIYATPESGGPQSKAKGVLRFSAVFVAATISGIATSAIAVSILMVDIWKNSTTLVAGSQISNSIHMESALSQAIDDIRDVRDQNLTNFFQRKCEYLAMYSEHVDPEHYKEHPKRKLEISAKITEAKQLRESLVKGGVCSENS